MENGSKVILFWKCMWMEHTYPPHWTINKKNKEIVISVCALATMDTTDENLKWRMVSYSIHLK